MILSSVHIWYDTRIFFKEIQSLLKAGYEIEFYALDDGKNNQVLRHENLKQVTYPRKGKLARIKMWRTLLQKVAASDAEIIHFHDPELLRLAPKIKKIKPNSCVIYDMHENFPKQLLTKEWIPTSILRSSLARGIKKFEEKWLESCDGVIFAEKSYKKDYLFYHGEQVEILNYPLWQKDLKIKKASIFTMLYVGDITVDRNIYGMLEVVHLLKQKVDRPFKLQLIGSMSKELELDFNKKINEYGIRHNVEWIGRVPYSQIWEYCFQANVGLSILKDIPNYRESVPTKLYEYMAAKLPVILSDFPLWKEIIQEANCGMVVDPENSEKIASIIGQMLENPFFSQKMGENGRRYYENYANWQPEEIKLLSFYEQMSQDRSLQSE